MYSISLTTAEQACKLVGAGTMQLRLHGSHNMGCTEEPQNNGQFGTSTTIKFLSFRERSLSLEVERCISTMNTGMSLDV